MKTTIAETIVEWDDNKNRINIRKHHISFETAASYFKSFDAMVAAFEVTTGVEYDIKEDYDSFPDTEYVAIEKIFRQKGWPYSKIFTSPYENRVNLAKALHFRRGIYYTAAAKYLHL